MSRAPVPSAMMRLFRSIGSILGFALGGGLCALLAAASPPPSASAPSAGEAPEIPLPVEEIESPERLEERPIGLGLSGRVSIRDSLTAWSVGAVGTRGSWSVGSRVGYGPGMRLHAATAVIVERHAGVHVALGSVAVRSAGVLFGERLGLASRAARLPSVRSEPPSMGAPGSAVSPGVEGAAVSWMAREAVRGAPRDRCVASAWAFAGRWSQPDSSGRRERLAAAGAVLGIGPSMVVAPVLGIRSGLPTGSVSVRTGTEAWDLGVEALASRAGFSALADAGVSAPPFRWRGQWRFRAGETRPIAGQVSAEVAWRPARVVVRASGGASGATGAVERREVEGRIGTGRGFGPLSFRLGSTGTTGFTAADGFTERRERYALLDLTVARGGGRAFGVVMTRRERETEDGTRSGTSAGGRLDLTWRRRGRLEVRVEAVRAEPGASAWSSGLYAGGATALRSRSRPGVAASARGEVRAGNWRLGGVAEGREDERGRQAVAATLWIEQGIPFLTRGIETR